VKRLEWIPQLAMDVEPIDSQHQFLFELYNRACDAVDRDEGGLTQEALLQELFAYAEYHFTAEEALLASIHYPEPELKHHKQEHRDFLHQLEHLKTRPLWELLDYVQEWLLRHVMSEDFKIKAYLKP